MHFVEVGGWQGLKPAANPKRLRGAEAPLFHEKTALVAFFSNLLVLCPANSLNNEASTTRDHARRDSVLYRTWFAELAVSGRDLVFQFSGAAQGPQLMPHSCGTRH